MVYTHYTRVYHYRLWYNLYVMNVRGGKSRRRTERFVKRGRQTDSWWSDCDIRWTAASWAEAMWVRDCADRGSGTQRPRRFQEPPGSCWVGRRTDECANLQTQLHGRMQLASRRRRFLPSVCCHRCDGSAAVRQTIDNGESECLEVRRTSSCN